MSITNLKRALLNLDESVLASVCVDAGILRGDLESLLDTTIERAEAYDDELELDHGDMEHFVAITRYLRDISSLEDHDQIALIKAALGDADCFDGNLEGFNTMLNDLDKDYRVVNGEILSNVRTRLCGDSATLLNLEELLDIIDDTMEGLDK